MPSTILSDNGVTSGTAGIKTTGSNDGQLALQTTTAGGAATTALTIDTSQNVGIGTTSPLAKLNVQGATTAKALFNVTGYGGLEIGHNADFTAEINQKSSQALLFKTDAAERMRIDSSGNVGIGTSSPSNRLTVSGANTAARGQLSVIGVSADPRITLYSDTTFHATFSGGTSDSYIGTESNTPFRFITNGSERARITSGGYFKASNDGTYYNSTGDYHELRTTSSNSATVVISNPNTTGNVYGPAVSFSGQTPNNTTSYFLNCNDSTNDKCTIFSSGTVTNRTGTYNSFSDLKLKQDVVDASSQWDDIKALRIVKYRLKDEVAADPNYPAYIGVIAQEVEQVSPGLVDNCPDFENVTKTREVEKTREVTPAVLDEEGNVVEPAVTTTETYTETEEYIERVATGTVTKSVKYSILYMKAVKALQEAMERIEKLEAEVTAMKAQ